VQTYLTQKKLIEKLSGRSRSSIAADLAAGRLPPPIRLGRRLYWPEHVIDAHLAAMQDRDT
jgi:prophage regulatory protein